MDAERLDQRQHLRLGSAQQHRSPASPQSTGEQREVDHEREVSGAEVGEIDGDVGLRAQRPGDRATPKTLRGAVLVSGTEEDRR
jgi:hypothetical protein